ncbi:hypothetical protein MBLNU230_g7505t1 [Neophaeotheca triangularis]
MPAPVVQWHTPSCTAIRRLATTPLTNPEPHVSHTLTELEWGTTATITISNPTKLNILTTPLLHQLITTLRSLSQHPTLRAAILTGAAPAPPNPKSPSFTAGASIHEMHALSTPASARTFITTIHTACQALRDLPIPVLARIDGYCLGAGLEIAASCDLRIATSRSVFGMPEVAVGIPSVVEAALLPGLIGMGRTRRLLLLGEKVGGVEAERWGLVERVVEDAEAGLDAVVTEWVRRIAGMGPGAVAAQKRLMLKWENCSVEEGIEAGVEAFADAFEGGGEEPRRLMGGFVGSER